jgi:beta-glucosidase
MELLEMLFTRRSLSAVLAAAFLISALAAAQDKPNDAIQPASRPGKQMERHESFNKKIKEGPVELIFIGDSITQGWEGAGKKVWEEYYGKRHAVNLGIGGDRTQHVLWRLDHGNIEGINPKLAVMMIGTNNARDNTPQETAAGVKAIVEKLRAKLPNTKILLLAVFPRGADKDDPLRKKNEAVNDMIKGLADNKMVYYKDIGNNFLGPDGSLSKETMPDLLHLNEKSYRTWAESIEPDVKKLLGEK